MATLTHAQLEQLWIRNGGNPLHADVAAAIAQAESGGCQYAKAGPTDDRPVKQCTYRRTNGENSYGLWQINQRAHPSYSATSLYTLNGNADAAIAISGDGANFLPWTTFAIGAYVQYLSGTPGGPQQGTTTGTTPSGGGASTFLGGKSGSSLAGWNHLGTALAETLPTDLHHARRVRRAALRELAGLRKVAK